MGHGTVRTPQPLFIPPQLANRPRYQSTNAVGVPITDKTCLIMDEVDGMSAGDRGGVGALNALIKKTKVGLRYSYF